MKMPFLIFILLMAGIIFAQTNVIDSIVHQTYQRQYTVHIPPGYDGGEATPVVIMLHGGSGDMSSAQGFTQLNLVSNYYGFLAVYPQGYASASPDGYTWADGRGTSADDMGIDDVGFVVKLVDTLSVDYNIDSTKIYLCGFSNGAFMTQRIACENNDKFAAMASLGSTMDTILFNECSPSRAIPMLLMMGTADPFVPYDGGPMSGDVTPIVSTDTLVWFWKHNNGCLTTIPGYDLPNTDTTDNSTVTFFEYTDCECNSDVHLYRINNGGHTWPGVEIESWEPTGGETNEDIHASMELWSFFDSHNLCDSSVGVAETPTPESFEISAHPNPFNSAVSITAPAGAEIEIFNVNGRIVATPSFVLPFNKGEIS